MATDAELLSQSITCKNFALFCGISAPAVAKMVKEKRIASGVVYDSKGKPKIIQQLAIDELARGYNSNYATSDKLRDILLKRIAELGLQNNSPGTGPTKQPETLKDAQLINMNIRNDRERLELMMLEGTLANKAEMYKELFAKGREIRDGFKSLSGRVVDGVRNASDRTAAIAIIDDEVFRILDKFSAYEKEKSE